MLRNVACDLVEVARNNSESTVLLLLSLLLLLLCFSFYISFLVFFADNSVENKTTKKIPLPLLPISLYQFFLCKFV